MIFVSRLYTSFISFFVWLYSEFNLPIGLSIKALFVAFVFSFQASSETDDLISRLNVNNSNQYILETSIRSSNTLRVNGDGAELSLPHSPDIAAIAGDYALTFWYKPEQSSTGGWRVIMQKGPSDSQRNFSIWMRPGDNRLHYRISTSHSWSEGGDSNRALTIGEWHHIAYVRQGNLLKLYINGSLDSQSTLVGTPTINQGNFYIGDSPWFPPAIGRLANIHIHQRTLDAAEVAERWTGNRGQLGKLNTTTINPTTGTPWAPGDQYRLVFISSLGTQATSSSINTYNNFAQSLADSAGLGGAGWKVIGSTSSVSAKDNTATNGTGVPIILIDGKTKVADNYQDFWDGSLDAPINMDEHLNGGKSGNVFVGSETNGNKRGNGRVLGGSSESTPKVTIGRIQASSGQWAVVYNAAASSSQPIYVMSDVLTVGKSGGQDLIPRLNVGSSSTYNMESTVLSPNTLHVTGDGTALAVSHSSDIAATSDNFALSFWYRPEQSYTGSWRAVVHKGISSTDRNFSIWMRPGDNRLHYRLSTTSHWNEGRDSSASLTIGKWHHIAYVREGNQLKLYINGSLDSQTTLQGSTQISQGNLYIGDSPWYNAAKGRFASMTIVQRAMLASEISAQYNVLAYDAEAYDTNGFFILTGAGSSVNSLSASVAALANNAQSSESSSINFRDRAGSVGRYSDDSLFPNMPASGENFSILAMAWFEAPDDGLYTFGVRSDDGFRLDIDGYNVLHDNAVHAPRDTLKTIYLDAGLHNLSLMFFEHHHGAELELFWAAGEYAQWNAQSFRLLRSVIPDNAALLAIQTANSSNATDTDFDGIPDNQESAVCLNNSSLQCNLNQHVQQQAFGVGSSNPAEGAFQALISEYFASSEFFEDAALSAEQQCSIWSQWAMDIASGGTVGTSQSNTVLALCNDNDEDGVPDAQDATPLYNILGVDCPALKATRDSFLAINDLLMYDIYDEKYRRCESSFDLVEKVYNGVLGSIEYNDASNFGTDHLGVYDGDLSCVDVVNNAAASENKDAQNYIVLCATPEVERAAEITAEACGNDLDFCAIGREHGQFLLLDSFNVRVDRGRFAWRFWTGVGATFEASDAVCYRLPGANYNSFDVSTGSCFTVNSNGDEVPVADSVIRIGGDGMKANLNANHKLTYGTWSYTRRFREVDDIFVGPWESEDGSQPIIVSDNYNFDTPNSDVKKMSEQSCWRNDDDLKTWPFSSGCDVTDFTPRDYTQAEIDAANSGWEDSYTKVGVTATMTLHREFFQSNDADFALNRCNVKNDYPEWISYIDGTGSKPSFDNYSHQYDCLMNQGFLKSLVENQLADDQREKEAMKQAFFDIGMMAFSNGVGVAAGTASAAAKTGTQAAKLVKAAKYATQALGLVDQGLGIASMAAQFYVVGFESIPECRDLTGAAREGCYAQVIAGSLVSLASSVGESTLYNKSGEFFYEMATKVPNNNTTDINSNTFYDPNFSAADFQALVDNTRELAVVETKQVETHVDLWEGSIPEIDLVSYYLIHGDAASQDINMSLYALSKSKIATNQAFVSGLDQRIKQIANNGNNTANRNALGEYLDAWKFIEGSLDEANFRMLDELDDFQIELFLDNATASGKTDAQKAAFANDFLAQLRTVTNELGPNAVCTIN